MFWAKHFIIGLILVILLYPIYGIKVLIILASSILIDADHYLWYIIRIKSFNLVNAFKFYKNKKLRMRYKNLLHLFHTSEFLIILLVLSFYYEFLFLVLIGVVVHLSLDYIYILSKHYRSGVGLKVFSLLEWFLVRR